MLWCFGSVALLLALLATALLTIRPLRLLGRLRLLPLLRGCLALGCLLLALAALGLGLVLPR